MTAMKKISVLAVSAVVMMSLTMFSPARAEQEWKSSFAGLGFDIKGISLEKDIRTSMMEYDPDYKLRMGTWTDSQGGSEREDYVGTSFAIGAIWDTREQYSLIATPWHTGNLIKSFTRIVSISKDEQKPVIEEFVAAATEKYGEPIKHERDSIFQRRAMQMIYPIKNGKVADVPCYDADRGNFFATMDSTAQRLERAKKHLAEMKSIYCDAVLSIWYTPDSRNKERIVNFGAVARDFRLDLEAFVADTKVRADATTARQQATPSASPDL
ncbi:hypothetical protein ACFQ3K_06670 [Brucella gallinifaecis]|uniref:Uncharacterized protein n=1 Tax=Brucella gallinifaecis TaxID=215590 RepID=A0A502BKI6_9HYPH|nr:hypothetical protein [Brucella gallinifaecis]TPF74347.1 hypothetical protein FHY56_14650 [Brucella gallinifaecis]